MRPLAPSKTSAGAEAIIRAADRDDARPLWICIWGGANTLAQALLHVRATRPAGELERFVERIRVYSITDQDDTGPWIWRIPNLFYIVQPSTQKGDDYYYATWTGISGDVFYRNGAGGTRPSSPTSGWTRTSAARAAGEAVPQVCLHHGRRHAFLSGADRQRAECLSPA